MPSSSSSPGYRQADAPVRPEEFDVDVVLIEKAKGASTGHWYLAGALLRDAGMVSWLTEPMPQEPELAWAYWSDHVTNGYNHAVFQYWARSREDAEELVTLRTAELAEGHNPLHGMAEPQIAASVTDKGAEAPTETAEPTHPAATIDETVAPPEPENDWVDPHEQCERLSRPHTVSQALVWRLCSELVRRHPDLLWVAVQGGGIYDRITLVDISTDPAAFVATLNAAGTNSLLHDGSQMLWSNAHANNGDPAAWVREFERRCGLPPPPGKLPASTPGSLALRWVAAFLTSQIGGGSKWLTVQDSALGHAGPGFDRLRAWLQRNPRQPHRVVLLAVQGKQAPSLAVTSNGDLWRDDGTHHHLPALHRSGQPVTALLLKTVPELLP
jgi:hypothetical protein